MIKEDWRGNRVVAGRFSNLRHNVQHGLEEISKWRLSESFDWAEKIFEGWRPVVRRVESIDAIEGDALFWLGHSSFYLQIAGKRILLDPVFYRIPMVRRRSKLPVSVNIFKQIDYIIISHDHYDHLDKRSIKQLLRLNPRATVVCGLNVSELIERWSRRTRVVEMGWYQQLCEEGLKITALPCQHWSKRTATDGGRRLWCAFMVESSDYRLYYSGDTGYARHFKELPSLFGRIDCAVMAIGAYKPRWFMRANHISPYQALDAVEQMGADLTIPMHYGTFSLSNETMGNPPIVFEQEARERNIDIKIPDLGEVVELKRQIR